MLLSIFLCSLPDLITLLETGMEMMNLKTLKGSAWLYYTTYPNIKQFGRAVGFNMTTIFAARYGA